MKPILPPALAMQITLPPEVEAFVQRQLTSGKYATAIDVIWAGMQLLEPQAEPINPTDRSPQPTIATAIATFRENIRAENLEIDPDEVWDNVRDRTPVADQPRW